MKSGTRLAIIGGGKAARSVARRLKYDFDVTLLSNNLHHLGNDRRLGQVFGGKLQEEQTLADLDDLCDLKAGVTEFVKDESGVYNVTDINGEKHQFDHLVLALGNHIDAKHSEFFRSSHQNVYTTATTMQSLRLRFNKEAVCRGKLNIFTAGLHSKSLFNAISVGPSDSVGAILGRSREEDKVPV